MPFLAISAEPGPAKQLEEMRARRRKAVAGDYWPNMSVIACWKGGTVGHYIDKFSQWFDPDGRGPSPFGTTDTSPANAAAPFPWTMAARAC